MADVSHDNRVLSLGNRAGLRQSLATLLDQLGRCQKALNEFLEVCTYGIIILRVCCIFFQTLVGVSF